jgi:hypothetical protein
MRVNNLWLAKRPQRSLVVAINDRYSYSIGFLPTSAKIAAGKQQYFKHSICSQVTCLFVISNDLLPQNISLLLSSPFLSFSFTFPSGACKCQLLFVTGNHLHLTFAILNVSTSDSLQRNSVSNTPSMANEQRTSQITNTEDQSTSEQSRLIDQQEKLTKQERGREARKLMEAKYAKIAEVSTIKLKSENR